MRQLVQLAEGLGLLGQRSAKRQLLDGLYTLLSSVPRGDGMQGKDMYMWFISSLFEPMVTFRVFVLSFEFVKV